MLQLRVFAEAGVDENFVNLTTQIFQFISVNAGSFVSLQIIFLFFFYIQSISPLIQILARTMY
ncbi:hypothetical protein [Aliikangiella sp. IMCC44632]